MNRIKIILKQASGLTIENLKYAVRKGISAIVPNLNRKLANQQRHASLRNAAEMMATSYRNDPELTAFLVLDGDDVLDG